MADKRMFSRKLISSDVFLDMPLTAQGLFFHLCMRADDDGFVDAPNRIVRECQATPKDLEILERKRYILTFENSNVVLIKHWFLHNSIAKDRYTPTLYTDERSRVTLKCGKMYPNCSKSDSKNYTEVKRTDNDLETNCNQIDNKVERREDKVREEKKSDIVEQSTTDTSLVKEIIDYLNEKTGASYRYNTKKTQNLINARLKEKFTLEDFQRVIDSKCNDWKSDEKMKEYLRPETLFGTKFESYLQNAPKILKPRAEPEEVVPEVEEEEVGADW